MSAACVNPDCPRKGDRKRRGLCQRCWLASPRQHKYGEKMAVGRRCRFCEVLLRNVPHRGDVCNYERCQREAAQIHEAKGA